jgi:hypothetical protein
MRQQHALLHTLYTSPPECVTLSSSLPWQTATVQRRLKHACTPASGMCLDWAASQIDAQSIVCQPQALTSNLRPLEPSVQGTLNCFSSSSRLGHNALRRPPNLLARGRQAQC